MTVHPRQQDGSVTVWLMLVPLLVMVLGGISVDLWAGLSLRGRLAAIADDAAAVGATAVSEDRAREPDQTLQLDPAAAEQRAVAAVDTHPEVELVTTRTAIATAQGVSVTVEGTYDFLLLGLVGGDSTPVRVTGTARPRDSS